MNLPRFLLTLAIAAMLCGCPEEQPLETVADPVPQPAPEVPSEPPEQAAEPAAPVDEAPAADELLVTAEELQAQLDDTELRILDVRSEEAYAESHIPGAVRVDLNDWKSLALSEGGLQDADAWAGRVGELGINAGTPVIVYADNPTNATRIWWTLEYLGVNDVRVLNGGWAAWQQADAPVSNEPLVPTPTEFEPEFQEERLAAKEDVQKVIETPGGAIALLDARSEGEYTGTSGPGARKGHIPGFARLEWTNFVDEQGRFKSPDKIREIVGDRPAGEGAITYCQTGGRASLNAFALELAGYGPVQNYYCGWSEWSAADDVPVKTPAEDAAGGSENESE
ncbi:Thiosulfate sulfurtransferase [Maioricimonas rarisocia]|uniref:Thiosulfate sulfurtransferase n=1 Tax=Maioricimonas rarisocia TaxID=2528026 RepID=A0A517ZDV4_9PLAN|nr:sulfurtransferase [Maioricimonas rarisocia]QDU40661.1 Thiosulfate sulfurtransferase [Maioricimonas rarisocia]